MSKYTWPTDFLPLPIVSSQWFSFFLRTCMHTLRLLRLPLAVVRYIQLMLLYCKYLRGAKQPPVCSVLLCIVWWHQILPCFYSCTLEKHLNFYDIGHWYVQPFCFTKASLSTVCERHAFGDHEMDTVNCDMLQSQTKRHSTHLNVADC